MYIMDNFISRISTMRRTRIRWRVPANSIFRTTNGGTRIEIDKNKLRAKLNAAARVGAARSNAARPSAARPSAARPSPSRPQPGPGGKKATPQQRAQAAQNAPEAQNLRPEKMLEGLIRKKKLVWARHPDQNIDVIVVPETGCMVVDLRSRPIERASRMPFGTRSPNLEKHADLLIEREGEYPYMRLDPNGNVTVGVGYKLGSQNEALALRDVFFFKAGTGGNEDGRPVTKTKPYVRSLKPCEQRFSTNPKNIRASPTFEWIHLITANFLPMIRM
jgi:hypothetical protein